MIDKGNFGLALTYIAASVIGAVALTGVGVFAVRAL